MNFVPAKWRSICFLLLLISFCGWSNATSCSQAAISGQIPPQTMATIQFCHLTNISSSNPYYIQQLAAVFPGNASEGLLGAPVVNSTGLARILPTLTYQPADCLPGALLCQPRSVRVWPPLTAQLKTTEELVFGLYINQHPTNIIQEMVSLTIAEQVSKTPSLGLMGRPVSSPVGCQNPFPWYWYPVAPALVVLPSHSDARVFLYYQGWEGDRATYGMGRWDANSQHFVLDEWLFSLGSHDLTATSASCNITWSSVDSVL